MKDSLTSQKTDASATRGTQAQSSAGAQGIALAPPSYGIAGLDQASAATQSSHTLTPPGPSTVWDAVERSLETDADHQQTYALPSQQVTVGSEQHTLFYEDHDGKLDIMLASNPKLLMSQLTGVTPNQNGSLIEQLTYHVIIFDDAASGWKNEFGRALKHNLTQLQAALNHSAGGPLPEEVGPRPQTGVTWGRVLNFFRGTTRGTSMEANPLTLHPPAGAAIYGQQPQKDYMPHIAGHLLNHHLYGPASDENLVPMSRAMNEAFSSNIEEKVKQAVLMENRVLYYKVEALPDTKPVPDKIKVTVKERDNTNTADLPGGWIGDYEVTQSGTVTRIQDRNPPVVQDGDLMGAAFERLKAEKAALTAQPTLSSAESNRLAAIGRAEAMRTGNPVWQQSILAFNARREWQLEHSNYLAGLLTTIAALLPHAHRLQPNIPRTARPTVVVYGPTLRFHDGDTQLECGTGMKAYPLSINPGLHRGTEPEQSVNLRASWVQGHLLNHHLHGRGVPKNLVPMTGSINNKMEREIENWAKTAVLELGETVQYTAEVLWYSNEHPLDSLVMTHNDHEHNKRLGLPNYPSTQYQRSDFTGEPPPAILPAEIEWKLARPRNAPTNTLNQRQYTKKYNVLGRSTTTKRRPKGDYGDMEDYTPGGGKSRKRSVS